MALTKVSTDGVKDDAITKSKIPANQIEASELADNAVDTNAIAAQAVTNAKLGDNAVSTARIADGAVNANKLGSAVVTTAKIEDNAVTNAKIADNAITSAKIGANQVTTTEITVAGVQTVNIQDSAVTNAKIASNAITTSKLNNSSVTNDKIHQMAASKLTGALPAIDGSALTGISGGLQMVDMWFQKQNVAVGNDTEAALDSYVDRMTVYSNSVFSGIGTGMTKSGSVFSFPSTGHYEIDFHLQFSCQGYDSARYTHADIVYTVDNSNYYVLNRSRGQSIEYPTNLGNRFSINITTAIFDVTNTSTHKVQFRAQHDQPYIIFGSTTEVTTYIIFKKLGDT